jgi:hypothetical protein
MENTRDMVAGALTRSPDSTLQFLSALTANITLVVRAQLSEEISLVELKMRVRSCNELLNRSSSELRNLIFNVEPRRSSEQIVEVLCEIIEHSSISKELLWAVSCSSTQALLSPDE